MLQPCAVDLDVVNVVADVDVVIDVECALCCHSAQLVSLPVAAVTQLFNCSSLHASLCDSLVSCSRLSAQSAALH